MDKPSYYAVIPANVRYDNRLTADEKLLYGEITCLTSKTGECWATNNYFASLYDVSKQTISKRISNLVKYGYIASKMIYKEGTKEVDKRILTIVSTPIKAADSTPHIANFKDNNINY